MSVVDLQNWEVKSHGRFTKYNLKTRKDPLVKRRTTRINGNDKRERDIRTRSTKDYFLSKVYLRTNDFRLRFLRLWSQESDYRSVFNLKEKGLDTGSGRVSNL